jgi:DNA primase large subunit
MKGTHENKQNQLQELQKQVDDFKNGNIWFEKEQQINILQVQLQGKINVIETMNKNKSYVHNLEHKLSVMEKDFALLKTALDAKDKLIDEQLRMLNSRRR